MALINFLKPKNQLEEGGRTKAPVQGDAGEPEKNCPNCQQQARGRAVRSSKKWRLPIRCKKLYVETY